MSPLKHLIAIFRSCKTNQVFNPQPATARNRRILITLAMFLCVLAVVGTMTWNGRRASAQSFTCGISQITSGSSTQGVTLAISDDGTRIAFSIAGNPTGGNTDFNQEIFIYTIGTSSFTQITNSTGGSNNQVSISANGSRIAFISNRNLTGGNSDLNPEVFFYDSGTATFTQVTNTTNVPLGTAVQFVPRISGDGSHIAFLSTINLTGGNSDHNNEYFLYEIASGNFTQLTNSSGSPSQFSVGSPPGINFTGTEVNFVHFGDLTGQNPDGNLELFSWHVQTGLHQLTNTTGSRSESFTSPSMSDAGTLYSFSSVYDLDGTNPFGQNEIFLLRTGYIPHLPPGLSG